MPLLEFIVVGLVAGWTMGKIRRGQGYGLIGNLGIGAIGSIIGWFLMGFLKVEMQSLPAKIVMALLGAIVFFLVVGLFTRKQSKKSKKDDDK